MLTADHARLLLQLMDANGVAFPLKAAALALSAQAELRKIVMAEIPAPPQKIEEIAGP